MGMYLIINSAKAKKHLEEWKKSGNKVVMDRIDRIYKELQIHPEFGIGKPEPLKYEYSEKWSRELDKKNRLIYEIKETEIIVEVVSAKGHYKDH
jgi:toxin YoeB